MRMPSLVDMILRLLPDRTPPTTMDRKEVRTALVDALQPMLMAQGFSPFKGTVAWRRTAQWIDVVGIGFIDTVTYRRDSPILEVGRYFTFVPPDALSGSVKEVEGQLYPSGPECHLRKAMFRFKRPKDTTWVICDEQDLQACCAEAQQLLQERAFPWFRWLDNLEVVLQLLRDGKPDIEGKLRDPIQRGTWNYGGFFSRQVVTGLVACQLQQWALCRELLSPVLQRGGVMGHNQAVFPLPPESLAAIRSVLEKASLLRPA